MKDIKRKKIGIGAALLLAGITLSLFIANYGYIQTGDNPVRNMLNPDVESEVEEEIGWQTVYVWTPTGENTPGFETGGFMSIFLLDYAEAPETVLQNNATDWSTDSTVHAYADSDDFSENAPSEDPFYVVVRACFNQTQAMDGGVWHSDRCRVTLTASGDETISQTVVGNNTAETYGGGIDSENNSDFPLLYINFYFDDNDDGYRITDDGTLTIDEIKIEAKW